MLKAVYFMVLFRRRYKGYVRTELLVDRNWTNYTYYCNTTFVDLLSFQWYEDIIGLVDQDVLVSV